ncbi:MAG: hypothetical protein LC135_16650 [Phycisphaerae bacterium]|nr:hypothetical protein [Phycisphaerae bacterium]MCZ2401470.1 hypothetical protein [Phycisphaerae bacterium]
MTSAAGTKRGRVPSRRARRWSWRLAICVLACGAALAAGCGPRSVSPLAVQRDHEGLHGRHMGGGQHFGQARSADEGTWATDWHGLDLLRLIELRWSHSPHIRPEGLGSY